MINYQIYKLADYIISKNYIACEVCKTEISTDIDDKFFLANLALTKGWIIKDDVVLCNKCKDE